MADYPIELNRQYSDAESKELNEIGVEPSESRRGPGLAAYGADSGGRAAPTIEMSSMTVPAGPIRFDNALLRHAIGAGERSLAREIMRRGRTTRLSCIDWLNAEPPATALVANGSISRPAEHHETRVALPAELTGEG